MLTAVLDTNVLVSGFVSQSTPPGLIVRSWRDGLFQLVVSSPIIVEVMRTLQKPYFMQRVSATQFVEIETLLKEETIVVPLSVRVQNIAVHPEDDLILATAVSAQVPYLVTGDKPLLARVGTYQGVDLVTPRAFLDVLADALEDQGRGFL